MATKNVPNIVNLSQVEEANIRVVRRFFQAAGSGDISKAHEFIDLEWASPISKARDTYTALEIPHAILISQMASSNRHGCHDYLSRLFLELLSFSFSVWGSLL